jgi:PAS domain S-box-containing protein
MNAKRRAKPHPSSRKAGKTGAQSAARKPSPRKPTPSPPADQEPTEERLRKSEERYRLISAIVSDYVFSSRVEDDGSLQLDWVAGAFEAITGYTLEEYRARGGWRAALHPEDVELDARDLQLIHQNRDVISTVRTLKKDGTVVWAQVYAHPIWDEENQRLIGLYGAVQDITERKQAETLIQRAKEFSNALLDSLPGVFYFYDEDLHFLRWNKNFETVTGYTADEISQMSPLDFFGGADRALVAERIRAVFASGVSEAEACFFAKDGTQRPYYFTGLKVVFDGKPSLIGVGIDITQRKQAEQALRESQKQLSLIFETVGDVIFLLAVEPGDIYRFASVNPVFLAATGLELQQVVGKQMEDVLPEAAHALVRDKYRQAILTNQAVSWEEVSTYPSGTLYGTVTVTPALDANGVCTHLIGSVHDITQIRRAEQEIRKLNQELEQRVAERTAQLRVANKELESFSYSVSHDLRAPLRAISGFAEIIARRHRASLNAEGQHYFDNIVQASDRMSHLIDDLLQYSRLGRQALRLQPVALSQILAGLAKDLAPQLAEIGGTLEIADDLPTVMGDKTLLGQIFANLLENGLTYRQAAVPLRLAVTWQAEDGAVVVRVRDNGIGIPAEYHQRIFNMFQRLHGDEQYPGTGIGLATVRKSAEMLGGTVWVESEVGSGSAFCVRLPKE